MTKGQKDKRTKWQKNKRTKGQKKKSTKGQKNKITNGQGAKVQKDNIFFKKVFEVLYVLVWSNMYNNLACTGSIARNNFWSNILNWLLLITEGGTHAKI